MNLNLWSISCVGGILLFIIIALIRAIRGRKFPKFCPSCGREIIFHTEATEYDRNTGLPVRWYHQVGCPDVRWEVIEHNFSSSQYVQNNHYAQTWHDRRDYIKGYENDK